jgi:predicted transposase YdaD
MDLSGLDVRTSVIEAVDECIKEDILSDFFIKHREEVIDVSIFEYDEEGVMEILREEARTAGLEEGRAAGLEEGRSAGLEEGHIAAIKNIMTKLGKSADEAMDILDIDVDKREAIKKKL